MRGVYRSGSPHGGRGQDHPRSRGVYHGMMLQRISGLGSSPLARGLLLLVGDRVAVVGIIPACAGFTRPRRTAPAPRADHPRLRGVYAAQEDRARAQGGSSPLARGLRPRLHGDPLNDRIIPACAGFTAAHPVLPLLRADHPRLRGVYHSAADVAYDERGSSPLARGLHATLFSRYFRHRIIPACAGFTGRVDLPHVHVSDHPRLRGVYVKLQWWELPWAGSSPLARGLPWSSSSPPRSTPDHPRLRGVYADAWIIHAAWAGSSPLARGLRGHGPARDEFGRIIPACAGFTQGHRADAPGPPDHPRLRGVYKVFGVGPDLRVGSSPLARGLPGVRAAGSAVARIIPACAGFTPRWIGGPRHERDHPRLRGVYSSPSPHPGSGRGSSPLARGLPLTSLSASLAAGIIPARAGFTAAFSGRGRQRGDHPRSRGVYGSGRSTRRAASGSSPLARGLRRTGPGDQGRPGIIPARAGFTP